MIRPPLRRPVTIRQPQRSLRLRMACALVLVLTATPLAGPARAQQAPASGPRQVGVITLATQSVPLVSTLPGRAVARDQVDIRPRVDGFVTEILYSPGRPIERGAPMFRIDATTYEAAVEQAEANLASARAAVPQAQAAYDRTRRLQGSASTQSSLEEAQATLEKAQAAQQAADAALKLAQIQLSWTTISSPLAGLPSVAAVSPGDLVTSGQSDALATVTQLDPIDVDMYEPSARLQRIRERIESGEIQRSQTLQAQLTLENGQTYAAQGEMVAPGYAVSTSTGAIDFRFRFDNPERRILPGMFVRGSIELGQIRAMLVPQLAATRGRDGRLSAWVALDGKAAKRALTEEGVHQNDWIITGGLAEGEQLIVNGLTGLTEGAAVAPVPVEIDDNGVVRDQAATAAGGPGTVGAGTVGAGTGDAGTGAPAASRPGATSDGAAAGDDPAGGAADTAPATPPAGQPTATKAD